ncbi:MAG: lysophospholipid acyltransferase family protein [Nitrospirae bacterium]|nr:lysophospholipid acyltransferase family protein [Nitrospirota bacterium]
MGKKNKKKRLWSGYLEYLAVLCLVRFVALLSYRLASDIGGLLGRIAYFGDARHRHVTLKNLQRAFPDKDIRSITLIAKKAFENIGRSAGEFIYIATRRPKGLLPTLYEWVTIEGRTNLDKAVERGKGVIYLTAHFGNWELLGLSLGANGYPLNVIMRPLDNPKIDRLLTSFRSITGARMIPKKGALKEILKRLRGGEGLAILIDQNISRDEGVFVDFFGTPAATSKGLALMTIRADTPVLPTFIIREGKYRHRLVYGQEIPIYKGGDTGRDVFLNTGNFTRVVESHIRRYPEQWFWMHQRWKTRPVQTEEK